MPDDIDELAQLLNNLYCENDDDYLISITIKNGEIIENPELTENSIFIKRKHLDALRQAGNITNGINGTGKYCNVRGTTGLEVDHVPSEESLRQLVFNEHVPPEVREQLRQAKAEKTPEGRLIGFANYMNYARIKNHLLKQVETLSYAVTLTSEEHQKYSSTYHNRVSRIERQAYIDTIFDDTLPFTVPYQRSRSLFDKENPEAAVYRDIKSILDNTALRREDNPEKTLLLNENYTQSLGNFARYQDNILNALDRIGAYIKLYKSNIDFGLVNVNKMSALKYSSKENMPGMYFHYGTVVQNPVPVDTGITFKPSKKSQTAGEKLDSMILNRIKKVLSI